MNCPTWKSLLFWNVISDVSNYLRFHTQQTRCTFQCRFPLAERNFIDRGSVMSKPKAQRPGKKKSSEPHMPSLNSVVPKPKKASKLVVDPDAELSGDEMAMWDKWIDSV
eukprot:g11284.t1